MFFDPVYMLFLAPAIILAVWAQMRVKSAYGEAAELPAASGVSGAEAAALILRSRGLSGVGIEPTEGMLSDHYDPKAKALRLSQDVYFGRSLAAVGVAAHEAGHALQDAEGYAPLVLRNAVVPAASFGSSASWVLMLVGFVMNSFNLVLLGIAAFSTVVVFQLVNLPVEYDASARARAALGASGIIAPREQAMVGKVLNAAALTYVAATVSAVLTLLYYLFRAGLLGGENRE